MTDCIISLNKRQKTTVIYCLSMLKGNMEMCGVTEPQEDFLGADEIVELIAAIRAGDHSVSFGDAIESLQAKEANND